MDKAICISCGGHNERTAGLLVNRLLPNEQLAKVGPFVFLGHAYPVNSGPDATGPQTQPLRGVVALSYLLSGSLHHLDSRGNQGTAECGGALWLKSGNGIIHSESRKSVSLDQLLHVVRFRINLPAVNKREDPEYRKLSAADVPELELPGHAGKLRVVLGDCGTARSPLDTYLHEFVYHIRLNPKSAFDYVVREPLEYAVFIPAAEVRVNGRSTSNSQLLARFEAESRIRLYNPGIFAADVFIFGGMEYVEPVVAEGPFVMNSRAEIAMAYRDFLSGKYGEIPNSSSIYHP